MGKGSKEKEREGKEKEGGKERIGERLAELGGRCFLALRGMDAPVWEHVSTGYSVGRVGQDTTSTAQVQDTCKTASQYKPYCNTNYTQRIIVGKYYNGISIISQL